MRKINVLLFIFLSLLIVSCQGTTSETMVTQAPANPPSVAAPVEEPITQPTQETEPTQAAVVDTPTLTANLWQWVAFTNPVEQIDVEKPENYLIRFNDDGTVNIRADCNNASGSYTGDGISLSLEVGSMTRAMCSPESRSDDFLKYLGSSANYFFQDGDLLIDLMADGGTMVFAPARSEAFADDSEGAMAGSFPQDLAAQLDAYLQSQVFTEGGDPKLAAPGLVLLVDTPEGRYLNAAGVSSLEEGASMQVSDRLEIGSNSKSFTIVVLMQLQEEGVLSFNDLLSEWLPELAAKIPNGDVITLHQLAAHVSGIWDYGDPIIRDAANNPEKLEQGYTPEELVQYAIDNGAPDFAPGEGWKYSNTGYILLGMIAEKATGQLLGDLYQERIFAPLGLQTAVLIQGVPQKGEITTQGYWWKEDDGTRLNTSKWNVSQGWAAGGIAMTAEDLLTYAKALAAGDLFQDPDSLAQMMTFNEQAITVGGAAFGLGLIDFGDGYWGHEGQTAGFQSLWFTNPEKQITVVGLTNSATYKAFSFLNVRNILNGTGLLPFQAVSLLPIADLDPSAVPSRWEWRQVVDTTGTTDVDPGTRISLNKDGFTAVKGTGCGVAIGTFQITPPNSIAFDLDRSTVTCTGDEPLVVLLDLLETVESWRFENGMWIVTLVNGTELHFYAAAG